MQAIEGRTCKTFFLAKSKSIDVNYIKIVRSYGNLIIFLLLRHRLNKLECLILASYLNWSNICSKGNNDTLVKLFLRHYDCG
jgi:hypothetical protein